MKKKTILFVFTFIILNILTVINVEAIDLSVSSGLILKTSKVTCGGVTDIPAKIPELTSFAVGIIQIAVPILLVIMGSIDLFKGITASKEDEIKKGQKMFVKRLGVAALIFFVVVIVKFLISFVSESTGGDNIIDCVDCFVSGECEAQGTFVCSVGGYKIVYDGSGNIRGLEASTVASNVHSYKSDFKPMNTNQCPTNENAVVELKNNINNGFDFYVKKK